MIDNSDLLRCLLVPLHRSQILLPSATVVEVVRFSVPAPLEAAPKWLLGQVEWHSEPLPAIDLDVMFDGESTERAGKSRFVVLKAAGSERLKHFMIHTRSLPRLVSLQRRILATDTATAVPEGALAAVRIGGQHAFVPDLPSFESRLLACLDGTPA
jgi:chemosensory pili system protein ChpC